MLPFGAVLVMALPCLSPSVREAASEEAETGTDVSGSFKERVVVRLHARLFVKAVDIGVREIEVQLLTGAAFTKAAHRSGHCFDLFIVIHRTDVHVGLHPLKGRPDGIEARGKGCRPVFVRAMWFARMDGISR